MPLNREDAGIILRRRLHEAKMSQADASRMFGKSRAWASQELFSDPKKTLRRLLIEQPSKVAEFARNLKWKDRDEMIQDLNLFEDTPAEGEVFPSAPFAQIEETYIPEELQRMIDEHKDKPGFQRLRNDGVVRDLSLARGFTGGPRTESEWLTFFLTNQQWLGKKDN